MDLSQVLKYIIAALPFALITFASSSTNLKKQYRSHQFATIILGLVYSIIAIVRFDSFSNKLLNLIKSFIVLLTNLSQNPKFASYSEQILSVAKWIKSIDWSAYIILIGNFLLLTLFYIIKRMVLPVFKKAWTNENVYSATSGLFYEFNEGLSLYCLKNKMFDVKKLMKVYFVISSIFASVLLVLVKTYPDWPGFKAVMYPFAIVIILGEIFYFLDGKTAAEYVTTVSGEEGSSDRFALYFPFTKYLEKVFGDRLLGGRIKFPGFMGTHDNRAILRKYEERDDQESILSSLFFYKKLTTRNKVETEDFVRRGKEAQQDSPKDKGVQLDESLIEATYKLLNGESVMFATPFYKDYSDYIYLPLNRALTRGNKVLFILGRNGIEDEIKQWISDSLEKVVNVPEMWDISCLRNVESFKGDVGIITSADIFSEEIILKNSDFFSRVTEVVLIEPSQFISTAQLSISVYISNIASDAVYYIFDKNNDGLIDTMSHIIKKSITTVNPTNVERNINTFMLWKAEGESLTHRLFPSVARYLGVGTELMISALKEQIVNAQWYSYNKFPLDEMKWISQQYYPVLCKYAGIPAVKEELEERMSFSHNLWGAEKTDYTYAVVEDEFCNMFEMARQFTNRARKESFINIISENYMLRDYMEFNPGLFENDPKAIPNFAPDFIRSDRNIALELILKLNARMVDEREVVNVLRYLGEEKLFGDNYTSSDVKLVLRNLICKYINIADIYKDTLIDERDKTYRINKTLFNREDSLVDDPIKNTLLGLKSVYYVLEDEDVKTHYLDAKLYGQVYQSHLPTQHVVIGGKYYEVLLIGADKGVILKRASDHINDREYYRQLRHYNINSFELDYKVGSHTTLGKLSVDRGYADFSVDTNGYLLMSDFGNIEKGCRRKEINNIPQRNYKNKTILRVTLPGATDRIKTTITLLLNELFKTIYSENSNYICAVTELQEDVFDGLIYKASFNIEDKNNSSYIYIIEDSVMDMGLISSVERNMLRIFQIITDYLEWYREELLPKPVAKKDPEIVDVQVNDAVKPENDSDNDNKKGKKKRGSILSGLFKKRKKKKGQDEPAVDEAPENDEMPENSTEEESENPTESEMADEEAQDVNDDSQDINDDLQNENDDSQETEVIEEEADNEQESSDEKVLQAPEDIQEAEIITEVENVVEQESAEDEDETISDDETKNDLEGAGDDNNE